MNTWQILWSDRHGEQHREIIEAPTWQDAHKILRARLGVKKMPTGSRTDRLESK